MAQDESPSTTTAAPAEEQSISHATHAANRSPRTHNTDSSPIPTDSMVTVSLSDTSEHIKPDEDASLHLQQPDSPVSDRETMLESPIVEEEEEEEEEGEDIDEEKANEEKPAEEEETEDTPSRPSSFELMRGSYVGSTKTRPSFLDDKITGERNRSNSAESQNSGQVDWEELEKTEEQEAKDEVSDEQIALLLARLEQENNLLATNPKSGIQPPRVRSQSRPPSIHQLKKMVQAQDGTTWRVSQLPSPPPMTELDFWAALVRDYPQTAQRLPTLTSNKVRSGIPAPLRGVVWVSMAGARDRAIEERFDELCGMQSPYENIINKDIGRSFPGVEMFRDPEGEGQKMLARVLKCFSLYDDKIGYCQGLGFLVGPLLMQMGDKEAFCVLVRLMEDYDLRSCFLPDLSGLHLRIYQFQSLLTKHMPKLAAHLNELQVEAAYLSQWFLSFFAVTCPLPMLFRIYDVIFAEGASETLMRVALSIMRRNEKKILASTEFEDVMQLLLSRAVWDTYGFSATSADELVNDFVSFTGVVTRDSLQALERSFREAQDDGSAKLGFLPEVQSAASRFLGRLWTPSTPAKPQSLSPGGLAATSRPVSILRRTASKQSMASSFNSVEASDVATSHASSTLTEATSVSRDSNGDSASIKSTKSRVTLNKDRDLHTQIEDLLTALSEMQREHALLAAQLQREREGRDEDRQLVHGLIHKLKEIPDTPPDSPAADDRRKTLSLPMRSDSVVSSNLLLATARSTELRKLVEDVESRFQPESRRQSQRLSAHETRESLRESLARAREQTELESSRALDLARQLREQETEAREAKDQLREARNRIQDSFADRQRLEKTIQDLKARKGSIPLPDVGSPSSDSPTRSTDTEGSRSSSAASGLREFRLGRSPSARQQPSQSPSPNRQSPTPTQSQTFSKRTSSLATQSILATDNHAPPADEALLLELVNAKTAEAVARQELEEMRNKFETMRKMMVGGMNGASLNGDATPATPQGHKVTPSQSSAFGVLTSLAPLRNPMAAQETKPAAAAAAATGGGFWGWGKRSVSAAVPAEGA